MPNTAKGTPYVQGSDLVSAYPTVSSNLATHIDDNVSYNAVTINAQTGTTYTFVLADASAGKLVTASNAGSQTYTVPPQSSVTWADGAVLRILNQGAGVVTIAAGAGVTINGTPLTLNQYAGAALQRTASNTWTIIPFTGGVGNANFSDAATGTYTSGGINYKYITYTASGTLNVTSAGLCDVLVVGGGGGGGKYSSTYANGGGGGGGGMYEASSVFLPAGSFTVTVGAGASPSVDANGRGTGSPSSIGSLFIGPGSGNGSGGYQSSDGGSGGGMVGSLYAGQAGKAVAGTSIGNDGGSSNSLNSAGGGGGASAAGTAGSSSVGGAGGAGRASSITGSSVTYAGGGGGSGDSTDGTGGSGGGGNASQSGTAGSGTANKGGGGGGTATGTAGAGGSGIVIVRVRT